MAITLNGTSFYPSDVQLQVAKIGALQTSANGARTWVQRTSGGQPIHKREWKLSWKTVSTTVRNSVNGIFLLATTFTFVDQYGTSYTVQCEADEYEESIALIDGTGGAWYDISLTIHQT